MPLHLEPSSLYLVSSREVSNLLFTCCRRLDNDIEQPESDFNHDILASPRKYTPKQSPSKEEVYLRLSQLSEQHQQLLDWLSNLPDRVVEDVVHQFLNKLELHLLEDMDNKLILTLINIEKMKINDFYFGLYSLLSVVQGFHIESLKFSKRLWYCLSQYGEITSSRYLTSTLISALPGLMGLTNLNISHVANDDLTLCISRCLANLITLDMSSSTVTDKGIRYLAGTGCITQSRPQPSSSAICNLTELLNSEQSQTRTLRYSDIVMPKQRTRAGCCRLEQLRLQSCEGVSDKGVMVALEHLDNLKQLEYHQKFSLLEILIKWSSNCDNSERMMKLFRLTEIEHGFPYGLSPLSDHLTNLSMLLPQLSQLTLVTLDSTAAQLPLFSNLTKITLELEDYLGEGFLELIRSLGSQLLELNVSCSSDPESPISMDQLSGPAGQQGQLFNAALLAIGHHCKNIKKVSVSGCGLVSAQCVSQLKLEELLSTPSGLRKHTKRWFPQLTSLIIMSYDDTHPAMTVHSGLLKCILTTAYQLRVLNLEGYFGTFINDAYFSSLLQLNPLTNLNILDICVSDEGSTSGRIPLSMRTVQSVLSSCTNIKELRISDWSVSSEEFSQLAQTIRDNNWDLTVTRKTRV